MYLYPNALTRVAALYRNIPWHARDFRLYLRALLRIGGWKKFMQRSDRFFLRIGEEGQELLVRKGYAYGPIIHNGKWGNMNIYDETRQLICRGSDESVNVFLFWERQNPAQRRARFKEAIEELSQSWYRYDPDEFNRVLLDTVPGARGSVPPGKNGLAPDYSTLDDALYRGERQFGRKKIKLTGVRAEDERLANALFDLDSTPEGYTWHHLDDWDPISGKCTMQLIRTDYHMSSIYGVDATKHVGGAGMWAQFHGIRYL